MSRIAIEKGHGTPCAKVGLFAHYKLHILVVETSHKHREPPGFWDENPFGSGDNLLSLVFSEGKQPKGKIPEY